MAALVLVVVVVVELRNSFKLCSEASGPAIADFLGSTFVQPMLIRMGCADFDSKNRRFLKKLLKIRVSGPLGIGIHIGSI